MDVLVSKIQERAEKRITPDDEVVKDFVRGIPITRGDSVDTVAMRAWSHIREAVEYHSTSVIQSPRKTLVDGSGDCKDMTFLMASILPNLGIHRSQIDVGYLYSPSGDIEKHVWNVVRGTIIDCTAEKEDVGVLQYDTRHTFNILPEDQSTIRT